MCSRVQICFKEVKNMEERVKIARYGQLWLLWSPLLSLSLVSLSLALFDLSGIPCGLSVCKVGSINLESAVAVKLEKMSAGSLRL